MYADSSKHKYGVLTRSLDGFHDLLKQVEVKCSPLSRQNFKKVKVILCVKFDEINNTRSRRACALVENWPKKRSLCVNPECRTWKGVLTKSGVRSAFHVLHSGFSTCVVASYPQMHRPVRQTGLIAHRSISSHSPALISFGCRYDLNKISVEIPVN